MAAVDKVIVGFTDSLEFRKWFRNHIYTIHTHAQVNSTKSQFIK